MFIEAWYKAYAPGPRITEQTRRELDRLPIPFGIRMDGTSLREGDGFTRLAEFMRYGDKPLVRLTLPNQLNIGRHRTIRDTVLKNGGEVFAVPRRTLQAAEIQPDSIEVVSTKSSTHAFRSDEQLIRSVVRTPRYIMDTWGFQSYNGYHNREAYFLSGYDQNESGLSYFLCELPSTAHPNTVDEAYEALKPSSVLVAEQVKRKVMRQGDMFFIRMPEGFEPDKEVARYKDQNIHHSNHRAEQVVWDDHLVYVRGTITHAPAGRRADHAPLKLGYRRWWLCVRNTVPVVNNRTGR